MIPQVRISAVLGIMGFLLCQSPASSAAPGHGINAPRVQGLVHSVQNKRGGSGRKKSANKKVKKASFRSRNTPSKEPRRSDAEAKEAVTGTIIPPKN